MIRSIILGIVLAAAPATALAQQQDKPAAEQPAIKIKMPKQVAKAVVRKATAKCKDDSYSFKRTDTPCAHHGGVAEWLIK